MPKIEEKAIEFELDTPESVGQEIDPTLESEFAEPFDYRKKYSKAYYRHYIENFEQNEKKRYFYRFVKRSFDIIVSLLALIILSPVMLIIAIAIKCDSKGPVIFKQKRVGKNGRVFNCIKFRSMSNDAPHECASSQFENAGAYYTRVGKFLRKTSLDEIVQFWCVFIGQMSFIGYRPLILSEENCNNMRERLGVFRMRPGISGYAQVHGRDDLYYKNKAILDAEYVKRASLWFDLKLIFKTIAVIVKREGNDAETCDKKKEKEKTVEESVTETI